METDRGGKATRKAIAGDRRRARRRPARFVLAACLGCCLAAKAAPSQRAGLQATVVQTRTGLDVVATMTDLSLATVTVDWSETQGYVSSEKPPVTLTLSGEGRHVVAAFRQGTTEVRRTPFTFGCVWQPGAREKDGPALAVRSLPFRGEHILSQGPGGAFSHEEGTPDQEAVDFSMPVGTEILAAGPGSVIACKDDEPDIGGDHSNVLRSNYVAVLDPSGTYSLYAHVMQGGCLVRVGDRVHTGEAIAFSGNSGFSTGPHLHFGVYYTESGFASRSVRLTLLDPATGKSLKLVTGETYGEPERATHKSPVIVLAVASACAAVVTLLLLSRARAKRAG